MTEHIKDKLIEFLSNKTTSIKKESMSSLKPFVSKPSFDLYLFHAYFHKDESQLKYVCDYNGFKPTRDYHNLYLKSVLNFLDLEDIGTDNVMDFIINCNDSIKSTMLINITFSFKQLKKNNQLDRFYDFYKNMLLDTKGLMMYRFFVEDRELRIKILLTDK
jgi:hypothetical protein